MVDLAKIRKKAKDKSSSRRVDASTSEPEPAGPSQRRDAAEPAGGDAGAPGRTGTEPQATSNQQPATQPPSDALSKLDRFKAEAGHRRQSIKATESEQVSAATLELLTFRIAGEQYAVEIERIVEIVPTRPVTRIPNADGSVVGIMSLRGTIVTLVDVRRKLGHPVGAETADTRVVVIDFQNETIGFAVDRVLRVVKLPAAEVEPHPVVHATELQAAIRGVFRTSGSLTILLDLDKLLDSRST
ncbi:MAG: chemotaxis protein CheW [Acidobacteriota bacterium]